jgi:hypothetical protein
MFGFPANEGHPWKFAVLESENLHALDLWDLQPYRNRNPKIHGQENRSHLRGCGWSIICYVTHFCHDILNAHRCFYDITRPQAVCGLRDETSKCRGPVLVTVSKRNFRESFLPWDYWHVHTLSIKTEFPVFQLLRCTTSTGPRPKLAPKGACQSGS